jgi:monoamine oxidase
MKLLKPLQPSQVLLKPNRSLEKKKVIVIGGGFSGLAVAYSLKDSLHYDVQILEGRDRLGGRVHPYDLGGTMVDLGGQWVHDATDCNPMKRLMKELSLPFAEKPHYKTRKREMFHKVFGSNGKPIDSVNFKLAESFYNKTLDGGCNTHVIDVDTSVKDLLDRALQSSNRVVTDKFMQMMNYLGHRSECYEGGRLHELSASLYLNGPYEDLGGSDEVPKGTYHEVIKAVVANIGEEKFRLGRIVKAINYELSPLDGQVSVDLEDGERIKGDYCVCTIPLGVLQKRKVDFSPELSEARWRSIDAIGMGLLDKVALKFECAFWDHDFFSSTDADPTRVKTFYDCSDDVGAPVLFMFHGGDAALRVDSPNGLSDDEAVEETMASLRNIFGNEVPDPVATKVTRWNMDPFAFGAYSFAKIGSTVEDYDEVASPLGNLLFAGEHTSIVAHSCVHGAWATGQREARRLEDLALAVTRPKTLN